MKMMLLVLMVLFASACSAVWIPARNISLISDTGVTDYASLVADSRGRVFSFPMVMLLFLFATAAFFSVKK
ncbi:MAG: hypothetical protein QXO69_01580 [archaeon]